MDSLEIVTIANVNLRTGPGIAFEVGKQLPFGYILTATEVQKDGGGNRWFKTSEGWINALYVKQPNQMGPEIEAKSTKNALDLGASISSMAKSAIMGSTGTSVNINSGILGSLSGITSSGSQSAILARRIYGTPYQFISSTDMRPTDGPLGLDFATNIMMETPIISILPGMPKFLADLTTEEKKTFVTDIVQMTNSAVDSIKDTIKDDGILKDTDVDMNFFDFQSASTEYMTYVNLMCRMCALYMGLDKTEVPGGGGDTYATYNWFKWHLSNAYAGTATEVGGASDAFADAKEAVKKFLAGDLSTSVDGAAKQIQSMNGVGDPSRNSNNLYYADQYFYDFFIKPPSYQESFSNQAGASQFMGALHKASDMQRELVFLMGSAGVEAPLIKDNVDAMDKHLTSLAGNMIKSEGGKKIMNRLITGAHSVITGAHLVFPDIWQESSYNRDFSVEINLSTPYGDKESIFLNIMVPMMHLLCLALPKQATVNSFTSPFLIRANVPGFFYCDMGIVRDLQITKGGQSNQCWSVEGLPTEVDITMSINDLYNSLSMSNFMTRKSIYNTLYNNSLLDYVGVQCGLNMKSSEYGKKLNMIKSLLSNVVSDHADYTAGTGREVIAMTKAKILAGHGG